MTWPIKNPAALDVWRNRVACRVCNLILNTVATKRYRNYISGSIFYGLKTAALDEYTDSLVRSSETSGEEQASK